MSLLSVEDALRNVLDRVGGVLDAETVELAACAGRVLAQDVVALRDQPPFPSSAMDGYAIRSADTGAIPATLCLIGTSAAGRRFAGFVGPGEAVRILTGAPVPEGADAIVIQENTASLPGAVVIEDAPVPGRHIRPPGLDFRAGEVLLASGQPLDARHLALAAAMGHGVLSVRRRPRIAVLATGDELVPAGTAPGPDQITASSVPAVLAIVARAGAIPVDLGIAADTAECLDERIGAARDMDADMLVTLGGASVGDHDLVHQALTRQGMSPGFWRVALRPGKPLMHGKLGAMTLLGLPGNPVSSIVCAILFVVPAIRALLGMADPAADPTEAAISATDLPANGDRQDYMRASLAIDPNDPMVIRATAHGAQDSSMLAILTKSDALLVRPPGDSALSAGSPCRVIRLNRFC